MVGQTTKEWAPRASPEKYNEEDHPVKARDARAKLSGNQRVVLSHQRGWVGEGEGGGRGRGRGEGGCS